MRKAIVTVGDSCEKCSWSSFDKTICNLFDREITKGKPCLECQNAVAVGEKALEYYVTITNIPTFGPRTEG